MSWVGQDGKIWEGCAVKVGNGYAFSGIPYDKDGKPLLNDKGSVIYVAVADNTRVFSAGTDGDYIVIESKDNLMTHTKTAERIKKHGEVYTPDLLVNQMLAKLPKEVWKKDKEFLDPACGDGQFLIWVLILKIRRGQDPLKALSTIYGADIMKDSIRSCRARLLKLISLWETITPEHIATVLKNVVWINADKHPGGSLEYDFEFNSKPSKADIEKWMKYVHQDNILDEVDLPVTEEQFKSQTDMLFGEDLFAAENNPEE